VILEPEYLDRIYAQWRLEDRCFIDPTHIPNTWDLRKTYQREYRGGFNNQRFEDWLFGQGFTVTQREGKRYLKFSGDEKRLTFFLLKHGVTA
jgi:hypothetical protein